MHSCTFMPPQPNSTIFSREEVGVESFSCSPGPHCDLTFVILLPPLLQGCEYRSCLHTQFTECYKSKPHLCILISPRGDQTQDFVHAGALPTSPGFSPFTEPGTQSARLTSHQVPGICLFLLESWAHKLPCGCWGSKLWSSANSASTLRTGPSPSPGTGMYFIHYFLA